MTKADVALRISLISRIAAQYTHELAYGMWNPDFCKSDGRYPAERFLEEMDRNLAPLRAHVGNSLHPVSALSEDGK